MTIEDFRSVDTASPIETDLCLIGSGPAGWTIAEELRDSGLRILVLESGGLEVGPIKHPLNETEDVGVPLFNGRRRTLGGTSSVWSGRCRAFDEIDFETRSWVPYSGWPFGRETIAPYFDRAAFYLGAGPYGPDGNGVEPDVLFKRPDIDRTLLENIYWEDPRSRAIHFGARFRASQNPNLRILVHATVTHLNTDPSGAHIESVEIACSPEKRTTVTARAFVLCAGGIENARILLYSNRICSNGVGNDRDVVGRFLMDHPRDHNNTLHFHLRDAEQVHRIFGPLRLESGRGRHGFMFGLAFSPERQRADELLNTAAWLNAFVAPDDPIDAAVRLVKGPRDTALRDAALAVSQPGYMLRALQANRRDQRIRHKLASVGLMVTSEQIPDPESRVRLHDRRDSFGLPIGKTDWRISPRETASQAFLAQTIAHEFARLGLPRARLSDWVADGRRDEAVLVDHCHPTGATRMSNDPRFGVVDADCQVHGVEGLYIAGSSIFPTAGHANPTLMIVAFAARLASHLERRLSAKASVVTGGQKDALVQAVQPLDLSASRLRSELSFELNGLQPDPAIVPGTAVAVTGATGFIGGRLVRRLIEEGAIVTCLVRGSGGQAHLSDTNVKIVNLDIAEREPLRAALAGIEFLFHCAFDWNDSAWNIRALQALIDVCRSNGCRRLVHLSSFVVYQLPREGAVTERTPAGTSAGYAHTKRQLESDLLRAARENGLPITILQPTLVYGPFSRPFSIEPADMLRYGTVVLPDSGTGICNAVYVDDVVSAMILATVRDAATDGCFLISGPAPVTWRQFYEALAAAVGANGPHYRPADDLARTDAKLPRLLRFASDPERILRRLALTRPGRKLVEAILRRLPPAARDRSRSRLLGPVSQRRGYAHLPDRGRLAFLQSLATVDCTKARRELGYAPQFDFPAGMIPTARYLQERQRKDG